MSAPVDVCGVTAHSHALGIHDEFGPCTLPAGHEDTTAHFREGQGAWTWEGCPSPIKHANAIVDALGDAHRAEVRRRERAEAKLVAHTLGASTLGVLVGAWGNAMFGWLS